MNTVIMCVICEKIKTEIEGGEKNYEDQAAA